MARAHYLYVLLFISACAIFVTTLFRIRFSGFWRIFLITDCSVLTVYLAWDFWAVTRGSWSFDPQQILGTLVLGKLPIEEILFFVIVPLMTILTYLALQKLTGWSAKGSMTYSDIALNAVCVAILVDLFLLKTRLMTRGIFWLTYGLILPFQLLTNWWLTSQSIVMYNSSQIIGQRLAGAPIEDLLFGFSMILFTLSIWEFTVQRSSGRGYP